MCHYILQNVQYGRGNDNHIVIIIKNKLMRES